MKNSIKWMAVSLVILIGSSFDAKLSPNEQLIISFVKAYNSHKEESLKKYLSESFVYISPSGHELNSEDLLMLYNYERIIQSKTILKEIKSAGDSVSTIQEYPDMLDTLIGKPTYSDQRTYFIRDEKIAVIKTMPVEDHQVLMDSLRNSWMRFYAWAEKQYPKETMQLKNEVQNQGSTMYFLANEYYRQRKKK